jgi:hypothetical protein
MQPTPEDDLKDANRKLPLGLPEEVGSQPVGKPDRKNRSERKKK